MARIQAASRKIKYLPSNSLRDWLSGGALIFMGICAIWLANNPAAWDRVVENESSGVPILQVLPTQGSVRMKRMNSSTWLDVESRKPGFEGDSVATGEGSSAYLVIDQSTRIQVQADSLVVIHLQKPKEESGILGVWQDLAQPAAKTAARSFVEIKSGSVHVASTDPKKTVKVMAAGKIYKVKPNLDNSSTELAFDPKSYSMHARKAEALAEVSKIPDQIVNRKVAAEISVPVPKIMRPARGTQFAIEKTSKVIEISLCWETLPEDVRGEVEVSVASGLTGDTSAKVSVTGNRGCAPITLARGKYNWRVRGFTASGNKTAWSEESSFDIVSAMAPVPIASTPVPVATPVSFKTPDAQALERVKTVSSEDSAKLAADKLARESRLRVEEALENAKRAQLEKQREEAAHQALLEKYKSVTIAAKQRTGTLEQDSINVEPVTVLESQGQSTSTSIKDSAGSLNSVSIHLLWREVPGAKQYDVSLFQNENEIQKVSVTSPRYDWVVTSIDPKIKLSYRISTVNNKGRSIASARVPVSVEVSVPVLGKPLSGESLSVDKFMLFTWSRTAITEGYHFQISSDPQFTNAPTQSVSENFLNYQTKQPGTYYWRVSAYSNTFTTPWSEVRSLVVAPKR